jgi:hypothetical protein
MNNIKIQINGKTYHSSYDISKDGESFTLYTDYGSETILTGGISNDTLAKLAFEAPVKRYKPADLGE